jgi:hypothetical protein
MLRHLHRAQSCAAYVWPPSSRRHQQARRPPPRAPRWQAADLPDQSPDAEHRAGEDQTAGAGVYTCVTPNGVAVRQARSQKAERGTGPSLGEVKEAVGVVRGEDGIRYLEWKVPVIERGRSLKYSALDHPDGSGRALFELVPGSAAATTPAHVVTPAAAATTAEPTREKCCVCDERRPGATCSGGGGGGGHLTCATCLEAYAAVESDLQAHEPDTVRAREGRLRCPGCRVEGCDSCVFSDADVVRHAGAAADAYMAARVWALQQQAAADAEEKQHKRDAARQSTTTDEGVAGDRGRCKRTKGCTFDKCSWTSCAICLYGALLIVLASLVCLGWLYWLPALAAVSSLIAAPAIPVALGRAGGTITARRTSRIAAAKLQEAERDAEREEWAAQMRQDMPNLRQCGRCGLGPVDHGWCSDLTTHHGERRRGGGTVDNSCAGCGWFSAEIADWPAWDGKLPADVNAATPLGASRCSAVCAAPKNAGQWLLRRLGAALQLARRCATALLSAPARLCFGAVGAVGAALGLVENAFSFVFGLVAGAIELVCTAIGAVLSAPVWLLGAVLELVGNAFGFIFGLIAGAIALTFKAIGAVLPVLAPVGLVVGVIAAIDHELYD